MLSAYSIDGGLHNIDLYSPVSPRRIDGEIDQLYSIDVPNCLVNICMDIFAFSRIDSASISNSSAHTLVILIFSIIVMFRGDIGRCIISFSSDDR